MVNRMTLPNETLRDAFAATASMLATATLLIACEPMPEPAVPSSPVSSKKSWTAVPPTSSDAKQDAGVPPQEKGPKQATPAIAPPKASCDPASFYELAAAGAPDGSGSTRDGPDLNGDGVPELIVQFHDGFRNNTVWLVKKESSPTCFTLLLTDTNIDIVPLKTRTNGWVDVGVKATVFGYGPPHLVKSIWKFDGTEYKLAATQGSRPK